MRITNVKREFKTTALAESESVPGAYYLVKFEKGVFSCSCPANVNRGSECKHIVAFKEELEFQKNQRESDHK